MITSLDRVNQVRQVFDQIWERHLAGALAHAARRSAPFPRPPRVRQSDCDEAGSHCLSRYRARLRAGLESRPAERCTGSRSAAAWWSLPSIGGVVIKSTSPPGTSCTVLSGQPMNHTNYRRLIDISFMRSLLEANSGNDMAFMTCCTLIKCINSFLTRRAVPGRHSAKCGMPGLLAPQIRSGTVR